MTVESIDMMKLANECVSLRHPCNAGTRYRRSRNTGGLQLDVLDASTEETTAANDRLLLMHEAATVIAEDPFLSDNQRKTDLMRLAEVCSGMEKAYRGIGRSEIARIASIESQRCVDLARAPENAHKHA